MLQALAILALVGIATGGPSVDVSPAAPACGTPVTEWGTPADLATTPAPVPMSPVFCQADCGSYPDVSCTGASSCSAVDQNCPGQRGYVVCDGSYTYCPSCPECSEGAIRILRTDECCDYPSEGEWKYIQKCINEHWVTQSTFCGPSLRCQSFP